MARGRGRGGGGNAWYGAVVRARVMAASVAGINETLARSVEHAKGNHPGWNNITATAEGSIRIQEPAAVQGARVVGTWGSVGVVYMRPLEFKHGSALRTAGDATYSGLSGAIQRRLK